MKRSILLIATIVISMVLKAQSNDIHINSLGFLPNHIKTATISKECNVFNLLDLKGNVVFSGKTTGPFSQEDVNQTVWKADFSEFQKKGDYILEIPNIGKSGTFKIADDIFNFAAKTSMRGFYLWRCGSEVNGNFNGNHYHQSACH